MRGSLFGQVAGMAILPSTLLGILPVGCLLYMHGTLSAETFLAVIVLSFGVMQPLITAFSYTDDIAQVKTIVDEMVEVLSGEDMQRPESAEKLPADNAIQLKDVHFAYHDKEVLHGIDLHIAPGTVNALVGPSGSGKSTIARAIMKDAPIIILDEATANVDPENEKELMEAVAELTNDKTVIMIAHRLKTVRHADQIFVVDHGEIVQQGTHDKLVAVDGLYRRFVVERQQAAGWKV
jgi:ABC-type multidrug transport system fused ATPase/permease subunit